MDANSEERIMATAKSWIILTDTDGNSVRINVAQIRYYRAFEPGSNIVLGGTGDHRLIVSVEETCEQIDEAIGGDLRAPTYGMMNL
jgi:hypothetical protein